LVPCADPDRPPYLLTVEGVASFGAAQWETEPFANSDSRDFNPGLLGVIVNIGIGWGRVQ
jgi:hypothetical protein